jgi:hypothetical protein
MAMRVNSPEIPKRLDRDYRPRNYAPLELNLQSLPGERRPALELHYCTTSMQSAPPPVGSVLMTFIVSGST